MSRRSRPLKRQILPDARFHSEVVQLFINRMMHRGKKSTATRIMYGSLDLVADRAKRDAIEVFDQALKNVAPQIEVKPRRVGGATYQVPMQVNKVRQQSLAIRWIITAARSKSGRPMYLRLAEELMAAYRKEGEAMTKRENTIKMAESNKAFAHFAW